MIELRDDIARLAWPQAFEAKDQGSAAARRAVAEAYNRADRILERLKAHPSKSMRGGE